MCSAPALVFQPPNLIQISRTVSARRRMVLARSSANQPRRRFASITAAFAPQRMEVRPPVIADNYRLTIDQERG
jgi:hypothetical protein